MTKRRWTAFTEATPKNGTLLPGDKMYKNNKYLVIVKRQEPKNGKINVALIHLSIRTNNNTADHDWRDLQRIKNELVGPEIEMVEVYPAESRLVDTVNQFHLWGLDDPDYRFPFGFDGRLVAEGPYSNGAKQRPFEDRPEDCKSGNDLDILATEL